MLKKNIRLIIIIILIGAIYLFATNFYNKTLIISETKILIEKQNREEVSLPKLVTIRRQKSQVKQQFDNIYQHLVWGNAGSGSGPGSTIEYTESARKIIKNVINEYSIKSMLDAPCGSFHWMPLVLREIRDEFKSKSEHFKYHGVDAVESIIQVSKQKYANETDWKFSVCDFSEEKLPDGYDLIFSRDALQHLSYEKIFYSLKAYSEAKNAKYLLVGSYLGSLGKNYNIKLGQYFSIDLTAPPFNLTQVLRVYRENASDPLQKSLLLYDIPNYLSRVDFDKLKVDLQN